MRKIFNHSTKILRSIIVSILCLNFAAACVTARTSSAKNQEGITDPVKYEAARKEVNEANRLFSRGQFAEALAAADRSLSQYETFEGYFIKGSILYRLNKTEESIAAYLRAENIRPEDEQLLLSLAVVYTAKGDLEKAQDRYVRLAEKYPNEPVYTYKAGTGFKLLRKYQESYDALKKADVANFRYRDQLYMQLGDVCLELRKYDEAEEYFRKAKEINPKLSDASTGSEATRIGRTLEEGNKAFQEGRYEEALKFFEEAINQSPNSSGPYQLAAAALLALERYAEAKTKLLKAIELNPQDAKGYSLLGSVHHKMNEYQKALEVYRQGIAVAPESFEIYNKIGLVYRDQDELRKSIDAFRKSVQLNSSYAPAHLNLALAYLDDHRYDLAKSEFEAAEALDSSNKALAGWQKLLEVRQLMDRGDTFLQTNRTAQAVGEYNRAASIRDDLPFVHNAIGRAELLRRNFAASERAFKKALTIDPSNVAAMQGLVRVYGVQNKNADRDRALEQLSLLTKGSAAAAVALGRLKEDSGNLKEAETYYLDELKQNDRPEIRRRLGIVYYRMALESNTKEEYREALGFFEKAKTFNPDIPQIADAIRTVEENIKFADQIPILKKAEKLYAERKFAEALPLYEEVYAKFSRPLVLVRISNCYMALGQEERGLRLLEDASKSAPDDLEIAEAIYTYLLKKGELDRAQEGFSQILARHEDAYYSLYKLGIIALQKDHDADAVELFTRSLIYRPDFVVSYVARGVAYYEMGDHVKAREQFEEARKRDGENGGLAYFNIGVMYFNENIPEKAEAVFTELAKTMPGFADPHYHLSYLFFTRNNLDRAEREIRACLAIEEDERYYYALTQIFEKRYETSKNPADAAKLRQSYRDLVSKYPASSHSEEVRRKLMTMAPDQPVVQPYPDVAFDRTPVLYAAMLFGIQGDTVAAVDAMTKKLRWSKRLNANISSILADRAVMILHGNEIEGYDPFTGLTVFSINVPGGGSSLIGSYQKIGVVSEARGSKSLVVFSPEGRELMRAANAADFFFAGGAYYQVNADGTLTRLASDDQTAVVSPVKIQGIVALGAQGDYVYVSQADKLRILKTSDLSRVAEINLNGSAVFGKNGDAVVIYTGSDQRVTIYDAAGRKKADVALRQEMIPGGIIPAAANRFFVISRDGKARLLDATGRQFWEGQLPAGDRGNFSIYY